MNRPRIAVLASGDGSNLQALIDHFRALGAGRAADIALVASNRSNAGALGRARAAGIPAAVIAPPHSSSGDVLPALLERHDVGLIVLAGYLQLVPADLTRAFAGRIVNVHPGPLPAFGGPGMYGARVHRAVLASGVRMSGPTVHFVDELYDHGATIAHWPVPVMAGDDEQTLTARVLRAEHLLLPRVVHAVASGALALGRDGPVALVPFDPSRDDLSLGLLLEQAISRPPSLERTPITY